MYPAIHDQGITLRQAALIAAIAGLVMGFTAPFAEFVVFANLFDSGKIAEAAQIIIANEGFFLAGMFAYLLNFICDVLIAWALYILLIPVNRSVSLLTAWFRLIYTVIGLVSLFKLATAFRLLNTPSYLTVVGSEQLNAQVQLLMRSFRYEWSLALVIFGIHLCLLGYLVYKSSYIPRILGVLLGIAGLGYLIYYLSPYLYPQVDVALVMITFAGELIFMLWLLFRGWTIQESTAALPL